MVVLRRLPVVGTTGLGFKIKQGIIVAVDSLAASLAQDGPDGPGQFPSGQYSTNYNKMYEMNYRIVCAMAGHLDTTESWLDTVHAEWRRSINYGHKMQTVGHVAAYMHKNFSTQHPDMAGYCKFIVAGYDKEEANLWETDIGANEQPGDGIAVIGSSQDIVRQFINDNGYDYFMGKERAAELARHAICYAGLTDKATGGDSIKVFLVKVDGLEILSDDTFVFLKQHFYPNYPMDELMVED